MALEYSHCPVCLNKGKISYLKLFQININAAVYNCETAECVYPFGVEVNAKSLLVKRPLSAMANSRRPADNRTSRAGSSETGEGDERLRGAGHGAYSLYADIECDFDGILEFIGDADSTPSGSKPSVVSRDSVG